MPPIVEYKVSCSVCTRIEIVSGLWQRHSFSITSRHFPPDATTANPIQSIVRSVASIPQHREADGFPKSQDASGVKGEMHASVGASNHSGNMHERTS